MNNAIADLYTLGQLDAGPAERSDDHGDATGNRDDDGTGHGRTDDATLPYEEADSPSGEPGIGPGMIDTLNPFIR